VGVIGRASVEAVAAAPGTGLRAAYFFEPPDEDEPPDEEDDDEVAPPLAPGPEVLEDLVEVARRVWFLPSDDAEEEASAEDCAELCWLEDLASVEREVSVEGWAARDGAAGIGLPAKARLIQL